MPRRTIMALLVLATAALVSSGCSSYYAYHTYRPAPAVASLVTGGVVEARVLGGIAGVRLPEDGAPAQIEARLRLENLGDVPLSLDPESILLVAADLTALEATFPESHGDGPIGLASGSSLTLDLVFPLPHGTGAFDLDLDGLNLRMTVVRGDEPLVVSLEFERVAPVYYGGWYSDHYYWHRWGYRYPYPYYPVRPRRHRR